MASIKNLKKDINNVLGDIIEGVYVVEATNNNLDSKEGSEIIDEAIITFDDLIARVNQKEVENRRAHLNSVRSDLETKATSLVNKLNQLG